MTRLEKDMEMMTLDEWRISGLFSDKEIVEQILKESDITRKTLSRVTFQDTDLAGSDFSDSQITDSSFVKSGLNDTLWKQTRLSNVSFHYNYLNKARFESVKAGGLSIVNGILHNSHFNQSLFTRLRISNSQFYKSVFDKTVIHQGDFSADDDQYLFGFERSLFQDCFVSDTCFNQLNLQRVRIEKSVFIRCSFFQCAMSDLEIIDSRFIHCDFSGSSF